MHLLPDTGNSDVKEGREPKEGMEPMPKNDVVVGVDWVCGVLDSVFFFKFHFQDLVMTIATDVKILLTDLGCCNISRLLMRLV